MSERRPINVRMSPGGLAKLQDIAVKHHTSRSEVIRVMLTLGLQDPDFMRAVEERLADV